MIVCHRHKVIFYHVPKTGGSSVKTILINEYEGDKKAVHWRADRTNSFVEDPENYIKFAVVRNPYSRMVSWYNHLLRESKEGKRGEDILKPDSFSDFIKNQTRIYKTRGTEQFKLWQSQKNFLSYKNEVFMDYVLKYENLQDDFDNFCLTIFSKKHTLPHLKKWGVQNNYKDYYTPELQEIVYNRLREDFDYFGYEKDIN